MDWMSDQWTQISWTQFGSYLASIGIIFGGVLPYIPQYREIHLSQNADGFSTYVCLTLLLANTLRIMFWFGHHFETPLLIQSVVMNIAMIAMVELCVRVKNRNLLIPNKNRYFIDNISSIQTNITNTNKCMKTEHSDRVRSDRVFFIPLNISETYGKTCDTQPKPKRFVGRSVSLSSVLLFVSFWFDLDTRYFWQWTDFISYIEFMASFTVFTGILIYLFIDYSYFVETIGFLSVLIEALLGTPQLLKNYKNKSTQGMSKMMVLGWTAGDIFKTSYFLIRNAPLQFTVCGVLQVSIDLLILAQTLVYRQVYKKLPKEYIK